MNYIYLKETEIKTKQKLVIDRRYWFDKMPDLVDSLYESNYFIKWNENFDDEQNFIIFANTTYQNIPYTFRVLEIILKNGYYLESSILIRTLYEMFVKVRYFYQHKEKCLLYSQKAIKIQYKNMFDEFSLGLYEVLYKQLLSEFAHGGYGVSIFRSKNIAPNTLEPIMGNFYSEKFTSYIINFCTQLFYGFLNYIPIFFEEYEKSAPPEVKVKRETNIKWLEDRINDQIKDHPKVGEFYKLLFPLIKI